jgi:GTP-binding protein HflX
LKASQLAGLEKLYRRVRSDTIIAPQAATRLAKLSQEIRRTIGLLLDRRGHVEHVIVGDSDRLYLPDIGRQRAGTTRLRGLRLVRTRLGNAEMSRDDLTDLSRLRLDLVAVIEVTPQGQPNRMSWAHLLPGRPGENLKWETSGPTPIGAVDFEFIAFIEAIEAELQRSMAVKGTRDGTPAVLVYVREKGDWYAEERLAELRELALTAGLDLRETIIQSRFKVHPRTVVGADKLEEIELTCLDLGADLVVFGQDLTPAQARSIGERIELRVIDRTQLILDIFAQHAKTKGGKLQVELAQLRYTLPRLVARNTAMSRLAGGIGGRGPGETKLEINRRRARNRIRRLEKETDKLSHARAQQRHRRKQRNVPVVAIIGYTNAGKSTLLNTLTNADVTAREQLFATLDPTSRRLRFPKDRELVLTDTVGFIHDLPDTLTQAFKATLEELEDAHLLIHLVDASSDDFEQKMAAVERILGSLGLGQKPVLLVFNKIDRIQDVVAANLGSSYGSIPVSAKDAKTLQPLVDEVQRRIWSGQLRQEHTA